MADSRNTPISIRFIRPDGARQDLGVGDIDAAGHITVTDPVAGMGDYLAKVIGGLNQRAYIIVKEPPAEDANRFAIGKRKVQRTEPDFIAELAGYAARVLALELTFDATAFMPRFLAPVLETGRESQPQTAPDDPITQPDAPDPDDIDPDAPQLGIRPDAAPAPTRPASDHPDAGESPDDAADADLPRQA